MILTVKRACFAIVNQNQIIMNMLKWTFFVSLFSTAIFFTSCEDETDPVMVGPTLLDCGFAYVDVTLTDDPDAPVDYIIDCRAQVRAKLTIEPGVVIHFRTDAGLDVLDAGTIVADGSASKRIVLEGENAVPGQWAGVEINSNDVLNSMSFLDIRHGGGAAFSSNGDRGNIIMWASSRLTLDNVLSEKSETWGINAPYNEWILNVTNSTITDNALEPVQMTSTYVHGLDASNDFTGNANDVIKVINQNMVDLTITWQKLNVDYFITFDNEKKLSIFNGGLTLEPGITMIFDADTRFEARDGFINAVGTAAEPITFTGLTKQPGAWAGLKFDSNNLNNVLDHVILEYTGSGTNQGGSGDGAIVVWADSYLSLSNSTISNSASSCGINATLSGENVVQSNNTFTGFTNDYCD